MTHCIPCQTSFLTKLRTWNKLLEWLIQRCSTACCCFVRNKLRASDQHHWAVLLNLLTLILVEAFPPEGNSDLLCPGNLTEAICMEVWRLSEGLNLDCFEVSGGRSSASLEMSITVYHKWNSKYWNQYSEQTSARCWWKDNDKSGSIAGI